MTENERLEKAIAKMDARKHKQRTRGITEPSKLGYMLRDLVAPVFRCAVSLIYPKSGFVLLGDTDRKAIKKITAGKPMIYAPAHRSVWDAARFIAHALPHAYPISGDEKAFYCTVNEYAFRVNGILHFDREDSEDCKQIIERGSKILTSNHSLLLTPEGVPNVYDRKMLKLYPGIIKMALDTRAIIVPVGNELHILRNEKSGEIIGDINYMMYEDYYKEHELFKPSDDAELTILHNNFKNANYSNVVDSSEIGNFIRNGLFHLERVSYDLNDLISELFTSHPAVQNYFEELSSGSDNPVALQCVREYLMKCSVVYKYRKKLLSCLNMLEQRMKVLSDKINAELDKRHPITFEERERNSREYVDYYLDVHAKVAKKGRSTAYDEIDKYINKATEESISNSATKSIIEGIKQVW